MRILLHPARPGDPLLKLGVATTDAQRAAKSEGFCPDCLIPLAGAPPIRCPDCRTYWPSQSAVKCGHHVPAGTRCKICQPAAK